MKAQFFNVKGVAKYGLTIRRGKEKNVHSEDKIYI